LYTWRFVNALGFHNKHLLGSLEPDIITWRALAKIKIVRGGSWGQGWGHGEAYAHSGPPLATPMLRTYQIPQLRFVNLFLTDMLRHQLLNNNNNNTPGQNPLLDVISHGTNLPVKASSGQENMCNLVLYRTNPIATFVRVSSLRFRLHILQILRNPVQDFRVDGLF